MGLLCTKRVSKIRVKMLVFPTQITLPFWHLKAEPVCFLATTILSGSLKNLGAKSIEFLTLS